MAVPLALRATLCAAWVIAGCGASAAADDGFTLATADVAASTDTATPGNLEDAGAEAGASIAPVVQKILAHLGLDAEPPAFALPRGPPLLASEGATGEGAPEESPR